MTNEGKICIKFACLAIHLLACVQFSCSYQDERQKIHHLDDTQQQQQAIGLTSPQEHQPYRTVSSDDVGLQEINNNQDRSARKCVPILSFGSHLNSTNNGSSVDKSTQPASFASASLSFAVGDIDLPVAPAAGSVHSAMKLLSAFDSQLGGIEEEHDENGEPPSENVVRFRQNKLYIKGLNLTMLNMHLYTNSEPKFAVGVTIHNTTLAGEFLYNGPTLIGDSKLAGYYRMSIDNILVSASSNLTKQFDVTASSDSLHKYRLVTNEFSMNISNLGYITIDILDAKDASKTTSNYLLKMLQRILQKTIKRTYYSFESYIRDTLQAEGRRFIDCELTRFTPILADDTHHQANGNASGSALAAAHIDTNHQDDLARILNNEIFHSGLAQVPLPNFDYHRNILGTEATIHFVNGSLAGLDHLRLNDETRVKLQGEHLLINASIGWHHLRPHYNWSLLLGGTTPGAINQTGDTNDSVAARPMSAGFVAFNLERIDFDAVISKGLAGPNTRIVVDKLTIRRLDSPKMDIGGLPGMNRVARAMVNFFMGRLKKRVASSIQPALKQQLEQSINRLSLFTWPGDL